MFKCECGVFAPLKMRCRRRARVVLPLLEGPDIPIITALSAISSFCFDGQLKTSRTSLMRGCSYRLFLALIGTIGLIGFMDAVTACLYYVIGYLYICAVVLVI